MRNVIQRRVHPLRRREAQRIVFNGPEKLLLLLQSLPHPIPLIANTIHRRLDELLMHRQLLLIQKLLRYRIRVPIHNLLGRAGHLHLVFICGQANFIRMDDFAVAEEAAQPAFEELVVLEVGLDGGFVDVLVLFEDT